MLQPLIHLPLDQIATISKTIFSDAFFLMKSKFVPDGPIDSNPALG